MPVIQFKGKTAIESYHHTVPHHTLALNAKLSVLPKGEKPTLDGNLIIEGDNLLALKALLPTHAGRIKCIYIDPPYNTGNEGWVYNDNLTQPQFREWIGKAVGKEGEDFTRHDKWCCMMYPRLQLLKELLRDDGAIFISIDDHEVHHLRMMMDEIFGPENLLATIVWKPRYSPPNDHKGIAEMHDFIVAYRKTDEFMRGLLPRSEKSEGNYSNPDKDPRGDWISVGYIGNKSRKERPNSWYPIIRPKDGKEMWPDEKAVWRFSPTTHEKNVKENRLYWGPTGTYDKPRFKKFRFEVKPGIVPGSWWEPSEVGNNDQAKRELSQILGPTLVFQNPKPVALIERVLRIATDEDDLILDSFAGSGTTAHATLSSNKEDGGNRRFILVQIPFETKENEKEKFNISQKITSERVRRVMNGYTYRTQKGKSEKVEGLGGSFSYSSLGPALFSEYRDLGKTLPSYEELAKYIFYTETSSDFDKKSLNKKTRKIGEYRKTSYYLFYTPNNQEDQELDLKWLKSIEKSEKNHSVVVYCEKIWIHRDDLAKYQMETGRKVRPMLIPFNLK
jgi:adenine-specific DNA-methyltransferase